MIEHWVELFHDIQMQTESDQHSILFIIPAYNEEKCIGYVIEGIRKNVPQANILVINDGSVDNTALIVKHLGAHVLNLPHNLGIGGAIRAGLALADELRYPYVVRMDGDGQHDADDIERLLKPVRTNQVDVVFGARFCDERKCYTSSFLRRIGIKFYGWVVTLIIRQRIHDATSGFWCMNRRAIRYFSRYFPQDYPEVESHVLLFKAGLRQMEIPVAMHTRINGRSSIGSLRSIYYVFKVLLAVLIRAIQDPPEIPEEESLP